MILTENAAAEGRTVEICRRPYHAAAAAALQFVRENICREVKFSDVSFLPKKSDLSVKLVPYGAAQVEPNGAYCDVVSAALSGDMPEYAGISVLKSAYLESGYVNFHVDAAFMVKCAEKADSETVLPAVPSVIELPESPEYAVAKLLNFTCCFDEFPLSGANCRALWRCLGLYGETDRSILKRRLRAAVKAVLAICSAENAALGGVPALAMAKLIACAADKVNNI